MVPNVYFYRRNEECEKVLHVLKFLDARDHFRFHHRKGFSSTYNQLISNNVLSFGFSQFTTVALFIIVGCTLSDTKHVQQVQQLIYCTRENCSSTVLNPRNETSNCVFQHCSGFGHATSDKVMRNCFKQRKIPELKQTS